MDRFTLLRAYVSSIYREKGSIDVGVFALIIANSCIDRFLYHLVLVKNRPGIMTCVKMNVSTEQDSYDDAIGQFKNTTDG